jgi:stage V sporulation protein D (sporulation-specific penicillin-binding protein)
VATRKKKLTAKLTISMRKKLFWLFGIVLFALFGLIGRLAYIEYDSGEKYEKKVLSMLSYDSTTIPYKRGNIVDCNGTMLATSVPVYNVILDCSVMTSSEEYVEPTIDALVSCFPDLDKAALTLYASENKDSQYYVLERKLSYEEVQPFIEMQDAVDEKGKSVNPNINGVWFEKEYQRYYPLSTVASSVVGFVSSGNVGTTGLENYYDDILNGVNGREYGYLNSDSDFEKTVVDAQDGNNLVISIDANIQSIVETKISEFNSAYANNSRDGDGSLSTAVLIMNPNNGEILAMADYPSFDLNAPRDLGTLYSEEELAAMSDDDVLDTLNDLWQNYCITHTYEPGSVQKPFTVACGLETGTVSTGMTFYCDGYENIADYTIHCVNRSGHGLETVEGALMDSCNDSLMQMSYLIGAENFLEYQSIFGFGQKTGVDLPGEANTANLVYSLDSITKIDLATNSFGQNYNCTMIEMASAFCSLVNGGSYYQPHVVTKTTDSAGNTISKVEPAVVKQTVSEATASTLKQYMKSVVDAGSGKTAKVDGYSMGGKTGTAQKYDDETHKRKTGAYLVSFMGFVPYDDPQLVIYCVVDEPNVDDEAHSSYAQNIVREILKEVLPYMNIYPDEELTGVNENLTISGSDGLSAASATQTTTAEEATAEEEAEAGDIFEEEEAQHEEDEPEAQQEEEPQEEAGEEEPQEEAGAAEAQQ